MSRIRNPEILNRAKEIVSKSKVVCNLGGCRNHSGHEFCDVDAAWEDAVSQAEDEALESNEIE